MINSVVLVGRITKDPELKSTQSNISFCNFTLAVNKQFADQNGETQADFISCVAWRKTAENMATYLKKGSMIGLTGRIQTRSYEVDGNMRYVTEIVCDSVQFLESKKLNDESSNVDESEDDFYESSKKLEQEEDLPF